MAAPQRQANPIRTAGFTMVEVLVSIAVFAIILVSILSLVNAIVVTAQESRIAQAATELVQQQVEIIRNLPYDSVGTLTGIPAGVLEYSRTVNHGGLEFLMLTTVRNIDDPFDGELGGSPNDLSPADYKLVEIELTCTNCKSEKKYRMTTTQSPVAIEGSSTNGALFIQVVDSYALPISGAEVNVAHTTDPGIDIDDVTDVEGWLKIVDVPPGVNTYAITVTKTGYSTDQTYAVGDPPGNDDPTKKHATVEVQAITQVTMTIDPNNGSLNVSTVYDDCTPIPNVPLDVTGAKTIGDAPVVYKYDQSHTTDGTGTLSITGMETDYYTFGYTLPTHDLHGFDPFNPVFLEPDTSQDVRIVFADPDPKTLAVNVMDDNQDPIDDTSVTLSPPTLAVTHTDDTDFSGSTLTNTVIEGTGNPAQIQLDTLAPDWQEIADTGGSITETTDTHFNAGALTDVVVTGTGADASLELTGVGWSSVATPQTSMAWRDISMVDENFGMAVAGDGDDSIVARWNGSSWQTVSFPNDHYHLYAVDMVSSNFGMAVGEDDSAQAYWNGSSWQDHSNISGWNSADMYDVDCWNADNCMVVGQSERVAWDTGWWGWTDEIFIGLPGSQHIYGVEYVSDNTMYLVTDDGDIYEGEEDWSWGSGWHLNLTNMNSGTSTQLNDIECATANSCLAVGENGVIRYYNGSSWSGHTSGTTEDLKRVSMISTSDAVAVGENGTVLRWDGSTWSSEASGTTEDLRAVDFTGSEYGYAAGGSGVIIGFTGPPTGTFESQVLDSGAADTAWGIASWNAEVPSGATITVATRTSNTNPPTGGYTNLDSVGGEDDRGEVDSGNGRYLQYRLTMQPGGGGTISFDDITFSHGAAGSSTYLAADMVSTNDGWAVGTDGAIKRWNGSTWSTVSSPTSKSLYSVKAVSAIDAWAVGADGAILRWNGSSWSTATSPTSNHLYGVYLMSSSDGWAVGAGGTILRWNGSSWSTATSPTSNDLNAIAMAASGDAWAVGNSNTFVQLSGSTWSTVTGPLSSGDDLYTVDLWTSNSGQAAGKNGVIASWNGTAWSSAASPTTANLHRLRLTAANDGWAVGNGGIMLRWNGSAWSTVSALTSNVLRAVADVDNEDVWVLGENGTVLHFFPLFEASGSFISDTIDAGLEVDWQSLSWSQVVPPDGTVTVATRSGNSLPLTAAWSSELNQPAGSTITSSNGRYFEYRLSLATTGQTTTPTVEDITINYEPTGLQIVRYTGTSYDEQGDWSGLAGQTDYDGGNRYFATDGNLDLTTTAGEATLLFGGASYPPVGTLTSATFDLGANASFGKLFWSPTSQPPETGNSIRFQLAANNDNATWNYVGPDGTAGTYYSTSGSDILNLDGNRYFRYLMYLSTDDILFTPTISNFSFTYKPACIPSGTALLQGLTPGTYSVTISKSGYADTIISSQPITADWSSLDVTMSSL
jgi:prepilin-type N-terminal cleavage/methylation domain-containing protein